MSQPPQSPQGDPNQFGQGQNPNRQWQAQPGFSPQGYPQQGYPQPGLPQNTEKKKSGCLKIGLIILAVLILFVVVIAAVSGGDDSPTVSSGDNSENESGEDIGGGVEFTGKTDQDTGANAGETITQKNVAITTTPLSVKQSEYMPAQLCTTITVQNDSDEQKSFNMFDWMMQDPNGAAQSGMPPFDASGSGFNSGELAPGGQTTGDLCFDGDPGAMPGEYVVLYQGNIFLSDRLAWVNNL